MTNTLVARFPTRAVVLAQLAVTSVQGFASLRALYLAGQVDSEEVAAVISVLREELFELALPEFKAKSYEAVTSWSFRIQNQVAKKMIEECPELGNKQGSSFVQQILQGSRDAMKKNGFFRLCAIYKAVTGLDLTSRLKSRYTFKDTYWVNKENFIEWLEK